MMESPDEQEEWLLRHRSQFDSSYEEIFAREILFKLPELSLASLRVQHPFKDLDGRPRFCDFTISEGADVRIAIEIDGYDKRGRGAGMSRMEFIDWQRRQASLVAQGWDVIRFANSDVQHKSERCVEHLTLLLRHERAKRDHRMHMAQEVEKLRSDLESERESRDRNVRTRQALELELLQKQRQLAASEAASALSSVESERLAELNHAQATIQEMRKESGLMKTTIWAFVALLIAAMYFLFDQRNASSPISTVAENSGDRALVAESAAVLQTPSSVGESCDHPLSWRDVRNNLGRTVAISGPVMRVTGREDVRGSPTWVEVGASFPSGERVTLVIWGRNRAAFGETVGPGLVGSNVCAYGKIDLHRNLPQIEISSPSQLRKI